MSRNSSIISKIVGQNIYTIRKRQGFTQYSLARALDMEQGNVSLCENGKLELDYEKLIKLSRLLKVKIDEFFINI